MVHGIIDENGRFVALGTDGYEPTLLGNCDRSETSVALLAHEVILFLRFCVVFHDVVTRWVSDFLFVDEMDVVGDR